MSTFAIPRALMAKRRSPRMALNSPIGLSGHDRQNCPFSMPATATNLNKHGAAIKLARQLLVGSNVTVRNARGTQLSARVISQLSTSHGASVYAIEFAKHDDVTEKFWGITFPPITGRAAIVEQAAMARRRR